MNAKLHAVEEILSHGDWSGDALDRVVLDYDDRFRRRIVLVGQSGTRALLDLAEPQLLRDGDGLRLESGDIIAVDAAPERLAEIVCENTAELVRVAWHLGNRHLPTQLMDGKLRIREDHVIIDMVTRMGAAVTLIRTPFEPEGGAYGSGQVHSHSHADTDSHTHSHD